MKKTKSKSILLVSTIICGIAISFCGGGGSSGDDDGGGGGSGSLGGYYLPGDQTICSVSSYYEYHDLPDTVTVADLASSYEDSVLYSSVPDTDPKYGTAIHHSCTWDYSATTGMKWTVYEYDLPASSSAYGCVWGDTEAACTSAGGVYGKK